MDVGFPTEAVARLKEATRVPTHVLLPISFALSRPLQAHVDSAWERGGVITAVWLLLLFTRFADRLLRQQLLRPLDPEHPGLLLLLLSALLQAVASAAVWLGAESAVQLGSVHVPQLVASSSKETALGFLGVAGTAVGFIAPQALIALRERRRKALHDGRSLTVEPPPGASAPRWYQRRAAGEPSAPSAAPAPSAGTSGSRRLVMHETGVASAPSSLSVDGAAARDGHGGRASHFSHAVGPRGLARAPDRLPSRAGEAPRSPQSPDGERRELFGFRRSMRSVGTAFRNMLRESESEEEEEEGQGREVRSKRMMSRGESIVANTEVMTQMALAAKNDELERLSGQNAQMVAGVTEALMVLSRASQQHAPTFAPSAPTTPPVGGDRRAAHVARDAHLGDRVPTELGGFEPAGGAHSGHGGGLLSAEGQRAVLSASLQAQQLLRQLLVREDDPHGGSRGGLARPRGVGGAGSRGGREVPGAASGLPLHLRGLKGAPREQRHAVGASPNSSCQPSPREDAPAGGAVGTIDEGGADSGADNWLTWTSAMGAEDVHRRVYSEAD